VLVQGVNNAVLFVREVNTGKLLAYLQCLLCVADEIITDLKCCKFHPSHV